MTDTEDKRYGRAVESVEVLHHLTDGSERSGPKAALCYVGYAEGGAAVLYSSLFFKGQHVAMSPPSKASPMRPMLISQNQRSTSRKRIT